MKAFDTQNSEQKILNNSFDSSFNNLTTHTLVYNPATDSLQSSVLFYGLIKCDWIDGVLAYVGKNLDAAALDGDTDWIISKTVYDGDSNLTSMATKCGSWTGRGTLF